MSGTGPLSIAEKEALARKNSVLLSYGYFNTPIALRTGTLPSWHRSVRKEIALMFMELVPAAAKYEALTGRHLPILGELGELFAGIRFGLRRNAPMARGSDGKSGDNFVESYSPATPR